MEGAWQAMTKNDVLQDEAVSFLSKLAAGEVRLLVADPPYGIGYHSNRYKGRNPYAPIAQDWNFEVGSFLKEVGRVLSEGGAMYLFCRYDVLPLWLPFVEPSGLKMKTVIVWVKDNWSAGDLSGCFGNQYEQIVFLTKGRHILRGKRWSNVWEFPRVPSKRLLHPAQKPVDLLRRAIEASSDAGDVVVDPFCGSGSTGEAAKQCGRDFLLCDMDEGMVRISRKRLGLAVTEEVKPEIPPYKPVLPAPEEWGLHPEELRRLYDEMVATVTANLK